MKTTILVNEIKFGFVHYSNMDKNNNVLFNDILPEAVFNDSDRMKEYGFIVLDSNNVPAVVDTVKPEPVVTVDKLEEIKPGIIDSVDKVKEEIKQVAVIADDDELPEEIKAKILVAAKAKPKTEKLIKEFSSQEISEYVYSPTDHEITLELEDGSIFTAASKSELLENVWFAFN